METKWLEDFVSLAETRSFSRSAQLRHVTQPAFSRRIQSLEAWAGTDLVDRSSYPTRLTPAGQTLYDQSLEMLQALQSTRAMLRAHTAAAQDVIEFAVPHTLAFTFFPSWLSGLRGELRADQEPADRDECARRGDAFGRKQLRPADRLPPHLAADPAGCRRYEMLPLAGETLSPYVKPNEQGEPMFRLPGTTAPPLAVPGLCARSLYGPGGRAGAQEQPDAGAPGPHL